MLVFFFAFTSLLTTALYGFRLLPSLQSDTMLVGDQPYPTAEWLHRCVPAMALMSVPFLVGGLVGLFTLNEARRRYIASLPRWKQWLFWPFHGIAASGPKVAGKAASSRRTPNEDTAS